MKVKQLDKRCFNINGEIVSDKMTSNLFKRFGMTNKS